MKSKRNNYHDLKQTFRIETTPKLEKEVVTFLNSNESDIIYIGINKQDV